jgi:competence protein ComEC
VSAWALPSAATAFWAGLMLWEVRPSWLGGLAAAALGVSALAAAWLVAPPPRSGPGPLHRTGLEPPEAGPITALAAADRNAPTPHPAAAPTLALAGILCLGLAWAALGQARAEGALLHRLGGRRVEATGTLREDPSVGTIGWHAVVDVDAVAWDGGAATVRETVWAEGDGALPPGVRGDRVSLEGTLGWPEDAGFAGILRHRGIVAEVRTVTFERSGPASGRFMRSTQTFRSFVGRSIDRLFPPKEAGLLLGLILGDDAQLDPALARDFQATGLGHLLVVSGENVAMVLAPILALATWLGLSRWIRFGLAALTVVFFVVLTGAEPSVLRAGVMAALTLLGVLMGRPRSTASILGAAVLLLIALDPWLIWSIGFQLSVGATAGMVALASSLAGRLRGFLPAPVALAVGTTLSAQLGVTPLLLFHFHEVPGITIVANLAAFPAVSPALLMGIAASLSGLVWTPAGRVLAALALLPMRYLEGLANALGKAPVGHITTEGGPWVLLVGGLVVIAVVTWTRTGWRPPRRVVVAAVAAFPLLVWTSAVGVGAPSGLTVRFFDVGQGDAALVTTPGGAAVLIDGGPDEELAATDLAALGIKRLDVVVASHPHADHIVGLLDVLARIPVGLVLEPGCPDTSTLQADLDVAIHQEGLTVQNPRAGAAYTVGDLSMRVLSPQACWTGTDSDPNNDALVLMLERGDDSVLFATEPEEPAQQALLDAGVPLHADVLKVPHHGAATSIPAFFQAVHARVAVVSVGENSYGHPVPSTLAAIAATGAAVYRTDRRGTVTITFEQGEPQVSTER